MPSVNIVHAQYRESFLADLGKKLTLKYIAKEVGHDNCPKIPENQYPKRNTRSITCSFDTLCWAFVRFSEEKRFLSLSTTQSFVYIMMFDQWCF